MSEEITNPVEAFGMYVAHVGLNAASDEEAQEIARLFQTLMGLPVIDTPVSVFSGTLVETMKGTGRGTHGHIAFHVSDLRAAAAWFEARGYAVSWDSLATCPDGRDRLVYFAEEIGGFAIHLTTDE